ncbi:MAG: 3-deoxy-7-phosphoheptulonate synthase [Bacteroidia bacterium]|nr:3-deoxy-7-phosphoheptulonate synthase [Bacteroidia bacterium]MDW8133973.1 3-deoxy-7-phosphoheptulonate synthase [Bacteroidia bacterium]
MWLLLRLQADPTPILNYCAERQIPTQLVQIGERRAIQLIGQDSLTPEAFYRWEEVERVISDQLPSPLVSQWKGDSISIGDWKRGEGILWIAGPCSVEERDSLLHLAGELKGLGVHMLRGGVFKARTSPYSFQGRGEVALDWLAEAKALTGLPTCVEILSEVHIPLYLSKGVDVFQIGARNMDNFWLLKEVGSLQKPVLLKRNPQATVEDWLFAAEYLLLAGAPLVLLCERGIRTFERSLRYTLDVGGLAVLAERTGLPRVADPSHAAGHWKFVEPLGLAALAAGAEGLLVEVHPDPLNARSDAAQQLTISQFATFMEKANFVFAPSLSSHFQPHGA